MFRIMTVCTGNICRSPMAQLALERAFSQAAAGVVVDSAGVSDEEAGHPMDPRAAAELRRRGYPNAGIASFRAREFRPQWFAERDLILALDYGHYLDLSRRAPSEEDRARVLMLRAFDPALQGSSGGLQASAELGIEDPWYGNEEDFRKAYDLIEAAVPGVVAYVTAARRTGSPRAAG